MTEKRFYISPNGEHVRWMHPHTAAVAEPDWLDATDWTDDELSEYILDKLESYWDE